MNVYLTFVLEMASKDPRIPRFQGVMLHVDSTVTVMYQHGTKSFESLQMLHLWLVSGQVPAVTPPQPQHSVQAS